MGEVKQLPYFLDLNNGYQKIEPNASPFINGFGWDINANGNLPTGTGNPSAEGQNEFVLTPTRANVKVKDALLPEGFNKNVGSFESIVTRELYYFNHNSNSKHAIYVINGDTLQLTKVIQDPNLEFSLEQEHFISEHRVTLRVVFDENKNITEKHLIFTDSNSGQKWINVIASIETDSFNATTFPYWTLQQPHFDRKELIEYATRPPMFAPTVTAIPNTIDDVGEDNNLIDKAFQFCYDITYTDGRQTTVSPFSLPFAIKSEDYLSNPNLIFKKLRLHLYAGSPMTEKITLYVRQTLANASTDLITWGNWYKYDVINKFDNCGVNSEERIGNKYWLRTNQWADYNYNAEKNTFEYIFSNNRPG